MIFSKFFHLSREGSKTIMQAGIRRLSEMGKTQFVITHDPELVEKCCDRFLFFENGKITNSGSWTAEAVNQLRGYFESSSE